jgi:hypothetical protein
MTGDIYRYLPLCFYSHRCGETTMCRWVFHGFSQGNHWIFPFFNVMFTLGDLQGLSGECHCEQRGRGRDSSATWLGRVKRIEWGFLPTLFGSFWPVFDIKTSMMHSILTSILLVNGKYNEKYLISKWCISRINHLLMGKSWEISRRG